MADASGGGDDARPFATAQSTAAAAARDAGADAAHLALCQERDALNDIELQRLGPGAGRTHAERARKAAAEARFEAVTRELSAARRAITARG